jgi:hypothetical protein
LETRRFVSNEEDLEMDERKAIMDIVNTMETTVGFLDGRVREVFPPHAWNDMQTLLSRVGQDLSTFGKLVAACSEPFGNE